MALFRAGAIEGRVFVGQSYSGVAGVAGAVFFTRQLHNYHFGGMLGRASTSKTLARPL